LGSFILDTNICVDLFNGNLLESVLNLPDSFLLPDVILDELKEPDGTTLVLIGYKSLSLSSDAVEIVFQYAEQYAKPSRTDLFALAAAKTLEVALLTGDKNLREAAQKEHVDVHGLLWLLDKIFEAQLILGLQLNDALDVIVAKGAWLPPKEVQHLKEKWKVI
jgi:predicted nucleic acid-binding protein